MIVKYEEKYLAEATNFIADRYALPMGKYGFDLHPGKILETIKQCADNIFVIDDNGIHGIIGGLIYSPYSETDSVVHVLSWCVDPEYRRYSLRLYKKFESHCKAKGFARISVSALFDDLEERSKLYTRMGYKPTEMQYMKEL